MILKNKYIITVILILIILLHFIDLTFIYAKQPDNNLHESHQNIFLTIFSKLLNFSLLVFILYYFLVKIIDLPSNFKNTFKNLSTEIQNAQYSKQSAEEQIKNLEIKLANIENEINEIQNETYKIIENEKNKISSETSLEINRLHTFAQHEIEWKTNEAIKKLKKQILDEAIELSKKIIKSNLNKSDQERLINKFLTDLSSKNNN